MTTRVWILCCVFVLLILIIVLQYGENSTDVNYKSFIGTIFGGTLNRPGENCMSSYANVSFSEKRLPITALASFPGSGNTWARHIIQHTTGYWTGSQFGDDVLLRLGFQGEGVTDGSVVAVKTHDQGEKHRAQYRYTRAVLVIRDPQDALIAEYHRLRKGHTGVREEGDFMTTEWEEYVKDESFRFYTFHKDWILSFRAPKLIIRYKEMQTNLGGVIDLVCIFMISKRPCTSKAKQCIIANSDGKVKRKVNSGHLKTDYKKYFTKSMTKTLNQYTLNVEKMIEECVKKGECTVVH